MGCVTSTRCPINVCRVTCVCREGLAAILSSLPSQLGPQRCPVTFSNGSPRLGCVYPLPFIPLALTKAFVLGFRLSRAWTSRRWAMSQSGTFVLFLLACLMLGPGFGRGWREDVRVAGSLCFLPRHSALQRGGVRAQAVRPGWYPSGTSLVQEHLGPGLALGEGLGPWVATSSLGC